MVTRCVSGVRLASQRVVAPPDTKASAATLRLLDRASSRLAPAARAMPVTTCPAGVSPFAEKIDATPATAAGDTASMPAAAIAPIEASVQAAPNSAALARIGAGERGSGELAVRRGPAERPLVKADPRRRETIGHAAAYGADGFGDEAERLEVLDQGRIVGGMDEAARRVGDEIDQTGGREIAVELGEGAERAAADPHAGERAARLCIETREQRRGRRRRPGIRADAVFRGHDEDGLKQGRERRDIGR